MRPGKVITATGFAIVMVCGAAAMAQDNFFGRPVKSFDTALPTASGQGSPQTVPGVKNYYNELFHVGVQGAVAEKSQTLSNLQMASGTSAASVSANTPGLNLQNHQTAGSPVSGGTSGTTPFSPRARDVNSAASGEDPLMGSSPNLQPERQVPLGVSPTPAPSPVGLRSEPANLRPAGAELPTIDMSTSQAMADQFAGPYMAEPAAVDVRWEQGGEITVGRKHACELVVTNSGASAAKNVLVEAYFPRGMKLVGAEPQPTQSGDHLVWEIPALMAGEKRKISVTVVPSQQGDLQISAYVRYTEAAATTLAVREPKLKLEMTGPANVPIGDTVAQEITISNPGTGTADDVSVKITLPPGLEHAKGNTLVMPVGSLAAGQSRVIRVALYATAGGKQSIQVRVTGGLDLVQEATASVMVAAPSLSIKSRGPSLRFVGREAVYNIRVINTGGAVANNVRIVQSVPTGFRFLSAEQGGSYEPATREVIWYLGRLEPGQSEDFSASLMAVSLGKYKHEIRVSSEGGGAATANVATTVDGTASLVVEVVDLDDPIEVGSQTAYEVRVRNEGTKSASNVKVACSVPQGVVALSARGPTAHNGNASQLSFAPIPELAPGKTALYRVIVKGTGAGKHRFRVRLTSDSINKPLVFEELTYYYAD